MRDNDIRQKVFNELTKIPKGNVTTYGSIAKSLGINPRQVGRILHSNEDTEKYPCHRVVFSDGKLSHGYAYGGITGQLDKLLNEGVVVDDLKVQKKSIV